MHRVCPDFTPETCSMCTRVKQLIAVVAIRKHFVWPFFTLKQPQFSFSSLRYRIKREYNIHASMLGDCWVRKM